MTVVSTLWREWIIFEYEMWAQKLLYIVIDFKFNYY